MAKFSRFVLYICFSFILSHLFFSETDNVRTVSSLATGMLLQCLTTCLACLILAFIRSWSLTLVILSTVPVQALSQTLANPLLSRERDITGVSATIIDCAISAISTIKVFNAIPYETTRAIKSFNNLKTAAAKKLNMVRGFTSVLAQFLMMAMFVQGFWFGAKLVRWELVMLWLYFGLV